MNEYLEGWQNGFDDGVQQATEDIIDVVIDCKINPNSVAGMINLDWNEAIDFAVSKVMEGYSKT